MLGEYWARRKVQFDRVYSGPRLRQKESARIAGEGFKQAGLDWPEPVVLVELDEYQAEAVMEQGLPLLLEKDARLRELQEQFKGSPDNATKIRNFQQMYEVVVREWAEGKLPLPDVEPWTAFCARVQRGLAQIMEKSDGGRQVAAFSSGGPVGVAMQRALGTAPQTTLQLAWMVRNGSFTEFLFSGERFTLSRFNAFPHLDDPALLTYR